MKKFEGWGSVSIQDMLVAYRKAKADCFFENTYPTASKFADYEKALLENLQRLLGALQTDSELTAISGVLGAYRLIPKKLTVHKRDGASNNGHVHFSNARRNFDDIKEHSDVIPDLRVIGDFPVETHILSALWINFIGHKLDAKLSDSCYGARLRRVRPEEGKETLPGEFHGRATGSFPPYFQAYQRWRGDGLRAIRRELDSDNHVIAVSLDLKSYYHSVDPSAIALPGLLEELGVKLDEHETAFNLSFSRLLVAWSEGAKKYCEEVAVPGSAHRGGLVIGLTASRVISNVLLAKWDRLVRECVAPLHYGRYVDDMFIVIRDSGIINNGRKLLGHLAKAIGATVLHPCGDTEMWGISLGQEVLGSSEVVLQATKQKLFVLQGSAGIDLLDSIEAEIGELSSEHRLMPSPDDLERSPAARVLSAAEVVGDSADTLRRADGLTIRRLSWALQLRNVETLAQDLPTNQWKKQRDQFYDFANSHILRPDTIFAHIAYIPRLLGFAISMNEWKKAKSIATNAYSALSDLAAAVPVGSGVVINGVKATAAEGLWVGVKDALTRQFADALLRFISPKSLVSKKSSQEQPLLEMIALELFSSCKNSIGEIDSDSLIIGIGFREQARLIAQADLAKIPYKKIVRERTTLELTCVTKKDLQDELVKAIAQSSQFDVHVISEFVESAVKPRVKLSGEDDVKGLLPYIFPTRPLTPIEISELAPECVDPNAARDAGGRPSHIWAKYVRALRGVWVRPSLLASEMEDSDGISKKKRSRFVKIGTDTKEKIVVALPSIETADSDWAAMACGKGNLSKVRYKAISDIVNKTIKLKVRPDYLIFPELSLPIEWVDSVSSRLGSAGISLIAGTEYRHLPGGVVHSEACMVLSDNRLGFPSFSKIWQPKLQPAVNEDKDLISIHGKRWKRFSGVTSRHWKQRKKTVYVHNGVNFGVMVCSELQNSRDRISFQGAVDALFVLCWNPDLDTFSSLIESTALDIHAYTVLVNNRKYGDSRIRVPAKKSFDRDLARVRGGDNDFLVAATLEISSLRQFQNRSKRWPAANDKYKPVPEGFQLVSSRRKIPAA